MADDQRDEILANLVAITSADEGAALALLEATDWSLEQAIELHYATAGAAGGGHHDAGLPDNTGGMGGAPGTSGPSRFEEEEVRAPLPSKMDRLYGDTRPTAPGGARPEDYRSYGLPRPQRRPEPPVDVFRDIKAESAASGSDQPSRPSLGPSLSDMFRPPTGLMYTGEIKLAGEAAIQQGRWVMMNVQSNSEFASHQLNRDTWSHPAVQEAVKGRFLFIQLQDSSPEGQQAISSYRLNQAALPAIMIIDPITSAKLYEQTGFVDAQKLLEDLVPFMDHGPQDPGASQLAQQTMRRKGAPSQSSAKAPAAAVKKTLTEDEELALAIAMSMDKGAIPGAMSTGGDDDDDEEYDLGETAAEEEGAKQQQEQQQQSAKPALLTPEQAAEVQQQAAARLPPEPDTKDANSCRVALRLHDGQRKQRRFASTDTLQVLHDFLLSVDAEAAAGRPYSLSLADRSSAPLTDLTQTLAQAGASNALLVAQYTDL